MQTDTESSAVEGAAAAEGKIRVLWKLRVRQQRFHLQSKWLPWHSAVSLTIQLQYGRGFIYGTHVYMGSWIEEIASVVAHNAQCP